MDDAERVEILTKAAERAGQLCANRSDLDPGIDEAAKLLIAALAETSHTDTE